MGCKRFAVQSVWRLCLRHSCFYTVLLEPAVPGQAQAALYATTMTQTQTPDALHGESVATHSALATY